MIDVRITLLANRLYLGCCQPPEFAVCKKMAVQMQNRASQTYESVRNPEAATPQILRFQEFRSSS